MFNKLLTVIHEFILMFDVSIIFFYQNPNLMIQF